MRIGSHTALAIAVIVSAAALPASGQPVSAVAAGTGDPVVWGPTGSFASSSFVRVDRNAGPGVPVRAGEVLRLEAPAGGRGTAQLAVYAPHTPHTKRQGRGRQP